MNVAIVAGGYSSEYVISVKSAQQVYDSLLKTQYIPYVVEISKEGWFVNADGNKINIDKNDFSFTKEGTKITFDAVFFAIHGTPGEDGKLQSYFEMLEIPFTTCNSFTSQLTFNKYVCKVFLEKFGITMANDVIIKKSDSIELKEIIDTTGLPCFVKANNSGSSFGVTKVKEADELDKALETAFEEDSEVLIEEFIEGTEVTCGVFKSENKELILPLTEIVSKKEFFDYEAKYTPGMSDEITPARLSGELTKRCQDEASRIYDILNCSGLVRVDFILKDNKFYFLEINTVPGMSENSLVPQQIRAAGYTTSEVYGMLIDDAINNR
jgi:D-alanine-D-alanine ligase